MPAHGRLRDGVAVPPPSCQHIAPACGTQTQCGRPRPQRPHACPSGCIHGPRTPAPLSLHAQAPHNGRSAAVRAPLTAVARGGLQHEGRQAGRAQRKTSSAAVLSFRLRPLGRHALRPLGRNAL